MATLSIDSTRSRHGRAVWLAVLALVSALLLGGCATGYGGYPGGSYSGSGYGNQYLLGTVEDVDVNYGRMVLSADGRGYGGTSRIEVFFDRNTRLVYQGREQSIAGLERGDRVRVDAVQSNGRLRARGIEVVQDVRGGYGGGQYGGELSGVVSHVDPRNRTIVITRGGYSGSREQVRYDANTRVEYRGQLFRPEQLDPGDVVRIQARPEGNGWLAERIWVEVDARSR
ncbi:MAG: DUF5666 domain-containing protein [Luteimonas sp.]